MSSARRVVHEGHHPRLLQQNATTRDKPDSYNIGGADVAKVNPIFDLNKNGQITAGEFRQYYYARRFPELS